MKEDDLPKGFTCECGENHDFPAYVHAHWYEVLIHTCKKCQRQHRILRGRATLMSKDDEHLAGR